MEIATLTRQMAKGDELAYRQFFDAYVPRLRRYLLVVTQGQETVAQEAIQGTLSRVVRHIRVFEDEYVFWSWLTVLARSALADERKKTRRYFGFLDRFSKHPNVTADAELSSLNSDDRLSELLDGAVALLPAEERKLIELKYTAGKSVDDIAAETGSSSKAIESKLGRIRKKLRETILKQLNDGSTR